MKKFVSLMMALSLMMMLGAAGADTVINWADVEGQITLEGQWVANEEWNAGFFLPSDMQAVEVTKEMQEQGIQAAFTTADGSGKMVVMTITLPDGAKDAAAYVENLKKLGYADAEVAVVNGYEMATYTDTANDQMVALSIYNDGTAMAFAFAPASDEAMKTKAAIMMASLTTYEEAAAKAQ